MQANSVFYLCVFVFVLFFLLATVPADMGCQADASAPTVARLWAATCEGGQ